MSCEIIPLILFSFICIMGLIWCIYGLFDMKKIRKQMDEAHEKFMEVMEAELKKMRGVE